MDHAIVTAIGSDRPGLVDEVSQFIFDHGGNLADSRMVNLRGQFAMMLLVGGTADALDAIARDIAKLAAQTGLHVEWHAAESARLAASAEALPYRLSATAIDQPGLVHRITHLLRSSQINIESLETHLVPAPITGTPMFEMTIILSVPRPTPIATVRAELGKLCDELNIDWHLAAGNA